MNAATWVLGVFGISTSVRDSIAPPYGAPRLRSEFAATDPLLLPTALHAFGRSSQRQIHCSSRRRCAPSVGVRNDRSFTPPKLPPRVPDGQGVACWRRAARPHT